MLHKVKVETVHGTNYCHSFHELHRDGVKGVDILSIIYQVLRTLQMYFTTTSRDEGPNVGSYHSVNSTNRKCTKIKTTVVVDCKTTH